MKDMEQPETPQEPEKAPESPTPTPRPELPNPKGALAIPDHFRLPFHGKMATPTAVPSAAERLYNLSLIQKRKRRRGFLTGLLAGQVLIAAMDFGGSWFLRTHPHVKLQAPVGVPAIVFLGMALGSAIMVAALVVIFAVQGLRALFGRRSGGLGAALGRGLQRVFQTAIVLGVSMAVILGTAWFLIPGEEWKPTADFAKERGRALASASLDRLKTMVRRSPASP
jgi:hypothetical protein